MAQAPDASGGMLGPYWRRQLGMTLPGERTGQQLRLINAQRAAQGLPPLGGAIGDNTRVAQGSPVDLAAAVTGLAPGPTFGQGMDEIQGQFAEGGAAGPHDTQALRQQLLSRVMQGHLAPTSRAALHQVRHAGAAQPRHPILPRRGQMRPY